MRDVTSVTTAAVAAAIGRVREAGERSPTVRLYHEAALANDLGADLGLYIIEDHLGPFLLPPV